MKQFKLQVSIADDVGKRENQQDALACSHPGDYREKGLLAVLSDGMGGMEDGAKFSNIAVSEMLRFFEGRPAAADIAGELHLNFHRAREKARRELKQKDTPEGGATVVALMIRKNKCAFLSVGDSSICLYRGGTLIRLNREQNLAYTLDICEAMGYMTREEARDNLFRKSITNHLCDGRGGLCDRNLKPFRLCPGDKLILMSDGISEMLAESEICACIFKEDADPAEELIRAVKAKANPRQDNMSAIIIEIFPA